MTAITAWSFSRYDCWAKCPLQFRYKFIDKLPEETTGKRAEALQRGDRIHKDVAAFLTGNGDLPSEAKKFERLLTQLRDMKGQHKFIEQQWGFDKAWDRVAWFGETTWLRMILDACVVYDDLGADAIDLKTGKKYGTNQDQLELFALGIMCTFPLVTNVTARLWYLDSGDEDYATFTDCDKESLLRKWNDKVAPMFADNEFLARPNDKCHFCTWKKSAGGPCRFG